MYLFNLKNGLEDKVEAVEKELSLNKCIKNILKATFAVTVPGSCTLLLYLENKREAKKWNIDYSFGHYAFLYGMAGGIDGLKGWLLYKSPMIIDNIAKYF